MSLTSRSDPVTIPDMDIKSRVQQLLTDRPRPPRAGKLTPEQRTEIVEAFAMETPTPGIATLARRYGVNRMVIRRILHRAAGLPLRY